MKNNRVPNKAKWVEGLLQAQGLPSNYQKSVYRYVAPLAERIVEQRNALSRPIVIGINGAQGSGKSTLALFLANWLKRELNLSCVCLSLDDLYLRKAERQTLARGLHPLFATRGVPGTHDVELGLNVLDALTEIDTCGSVRLPVFDKAHDDRACEAKWQKIDTPVDVVLFEGWCVGARPQPAKCLHKPLNYLEACEDGQGVWRRHVNERLRTDYAELFGRLDALVMLRIPCFEKVFEWRGLQEQKLLNSSVDAALASAMPHDRMNELERFIRHFERLTRHMLETMPEFADTIIDIDDEHRMVGMLHKS